MNLIERNFEPIIKKKNKVYNFDENVYSDLIKDLSDKPDSLDSIFYAINIRMLNNPPNYKIQLFELIDRLFNTFEDFRLPFLRMLQKLLGILIFDSEKVNSTEVELR